MNITALLIQPGFGGRVTIITIHFFQSEWIFAHNINWLLANPTSNTARSLRLQVPTIYWTSTRFWVSTTNTTRIYFLWRTNFEITSHCLEIVHTIISNCLKQEIFSNIYLALSIYTNMKSSRFTSSPIPQLWTEFYNLIRTNNSTRESTRICRILDWIPVSSFSIKFYSVKRSTLITSIVSSISTGLKFNILIIIIIFYINTCICIYLIQVLLLAKYWKQDFFSLNFFWMKNL
jgi:hypothetical protein